jgi:hypothetical protein
LASPRFAPLQQLRQLDDISRNASRIILGHEIGRRAVREFFLLKALTYSKNRASLFF